MAPGRQASPAGPPGIPVAVVPAQVRPATDRKIPVRDLVNRARMHSEFAPAHAQVPGTTVIEPSARPSVRRWAGELLRHRDLLLILMRRDISVRYKQAFFGFTWALAQPLVLLAVFTLFLHPGVHLSSGAAPYALFAMAGLAPWTFFQSAVGSGSDSLVGNEKLISKVYFPRLTIPCSAVFAWLPDLGLSLGVLAVLMAIYRVVPGVTVLLAPAFLLLAVLAACAVAVWTSALNVAYRDVRYAVPFILQLWLFATPGIYTTESFSGVTAVIVSLNPATGFVEGMRYAALGQAPASWLPVALSALTTLVLLVTGIRYFRRVEGYFADVI